MSLFDSEFRGRFRKVFYNLVRVLSQAGLLLYWVTFTTFEKLKFQNAVQLIVALLLRNKMNFSFEFFPCFSLRIHDFHSEAWKILRYEKTACAVSLYGTLLGLSLIHGAHSHNCHSIMRQKIQFHA